MKQGLLIKQRSGQSKSYRIALPRSIIVGDVDPVMRAANYILCLVLGGRNYPLEGISAALYMYMNSIFYVINFV